VAVENDYNLLVYAINNLAATVERIRNDVRDCLLREKRDGLEPNETRWVNVLVHEMLMVSGPASQLEAGAWKVLRSRPGEAVFDDQPPELPGEIA
jgi:hypothetical protein